MNWELAIAYLDDAIGNLAECIEELAKAQVNLEEIRGILWTKRN